MTASADPAFREPERRPTPQPVAGTAGYADVAPLLLRTRLPFAAIHAPFMLFLPEPPARVLDIGSGPGHDAADLAGMGYDVVAAEPTPELLRGATALHGRSGVRWMADSLPDLAAVSALRRRFAFILASGLWTHLDAAERRAAMPTVASLLEPGGVLALSLRHGAAPTGRRMHAVGGEETAGLAAESCLTLVARTDRDSLQPGNRAAGITWTLLAFRAPP